MTLGRPQQFDTDTALEAAMNLFWSKGYEACSLQDLLKATHLSKSSLYKTFSNKEKLFEKCLLRYQDNLAKNMITALNESQSGIRFIEEVLLENAEEAKGSSKKIGCFLLNTAVEFTQEKPAIAAIVSKSITRFESIFEDAVMLAKKNNEITQDTDAKELAQFIFNSFTGLKTRVKAGASQKEVESIVKTTIRAL